MGLAIPLPRTASKISQMQVAEGANDFRVRVVASSEAPGAIVVHLSEAPAVWRKWSSAHTGASVSPSTSTVLPASMDVVISRSR